MDAIAGTGPIETPLVPDPPSSVAQPPPLQTCRQRGDVRVVPRGGDWPASTSTWCWHCCHPFDGPPIPMPTRYDERADRFHVVGTFCSWECMKTFNLDSTNEMRFMRDGGVVTLFRKRCTGKLGGVCPAPPRLALKVFGGTMGIEEFRACRKPTQFVPPNMLMRPPVVEEVPQRLRKRPTPQQLEDAVSFKDATAQNEMLRLRRPKPLVSHNLLVKTMGLQILQAPPTS